MQESMVTGRMSAQKKAAGNAILKDAGLNPSQAINMLYSKLIEEKSASFLTDEPAVDPIKLQAAKQFIDSLAVSLEPPFDTMTIKEAKAHRLRAKGLL